MFLEWNGFDHKMILFSPATSDHLVGRRKGAGCPGQQGPEGGHLGPKVTVMNQEMPLFPGLFPGS